MRKIWKINSTGKIDIRWKIWKIGNKGGKGYMWRMNCFLWTYMNLFPLYACTISACLLVKKHSTWTNIQSLIIYLINQLQPLVLILLLLHFNIYRCFYCLVPFLQFPQLPNTDITTTAFLTPTIIESGWRSLTNHGCTRHSCFSSPGERNHLRIQLRHQHQH